MSKKWMLIAGIAALAVVAIIAVVLLTPDKTPSPGPTAAQSTGTVGSTTTASANGASTGGSTPSQSATGVPTTPGGASTATTGGVTSNPGALSPLKPYPVMPTSKVPAASVTAPVVLGSALAPLKAAPNATISGLKLGQLPDGSRYVITMRPYGIGPSIALGSRVVIRVDSAKPWASSTPAYKAIAGANMLVLVDTPHGGTVTKGGKYTAYLTFRSDGTKLLPIISNVKAAK